MSVRDAENKFKSLVNNKYADGYFNLGVVLLELTESNLDFGNLIKISYNLNFNNNLDVSTIYYNLSRFYSNLLKINRSNSKYDMLLNYSYHVCVANNESEVDKFKKVINDLINNLNDLDVVYDAYDYKMSINIEGTFDKMYSDMKKGECNFSNVEFVLEDEPFYSYVILNFK